MIKLFTIVKDENDIVAEWVHYHGRLFGYTNLYIIDNMSTDGTYEKLLELRNEHGCYVFQQPNYALKGKYMRDLMLEYCNHKDACGNYTTPIAYPIDIDEFVALYDDKTHTISCDKSEILTYFDKTVLPKIVSNECAIFKTNNIMIKIIDNNGNNGGNNVEGYKNAVLECTHGEYLNHGNHAKTFFSSKHVIEHGIQIDHGNHYNTVHINDYFMTDLVLVHYHCRSLPQMVNKVYNNVAGLGYPVNDVAALSKMLVPGFPGGHHVQNRIEMLNNTYKLPSEPFDAAKPISNSHVSLAPIAATFA